jgi:protein TonB
MPRRQIVIAPIEQSASAVLPAPTFVEASASAALGGESAQRVTAEPATVALAVSAAAHGPDAAGLRQYRLALAGEARHFRRYPDTARREGLTGTAEVRVTVVAAGATRHAELARSSGHAVLDVAALDMLRQAAARAMLPESLRGQAFAVLLPVVFEVEE